MPKSKLKPSEWIKERARSLTKDVVCSCDSAYEHCRFLAILDYLDQQEDNLTQ